MNTANSSANLTDAQTYSNKFIDNNISNGEPNMKKPNPQIFFILCLVIFFLLPIINFLSGYYSDNKVCVQWLGKISAVLLLCGLGIFIASLVQCKDDNRPTRLKWALGLLGAMIFGGFVIVYMIGFTAGGHLAKWLEDIKNAVQISQNNP